MSLDNKSKRSIANIQNYKDTFKSAHGKKVLWDLMRVHGCLSNSFIEGDSHSTAYNEGKRMVVLEILKKCNVNIQQLEKKLSENLKENDHE